MFNGVISKIKKLFKRTLPLDTEARLNDIAFTVNLIKNGMTVKIDDNTALTRIFTGQKMYVDSRDVSLAPHLMLEGYWEMEITTVIRRYIKSDSIFFDVGANVGYFSLIAGTHITTGQIHSFEANPDLEHLLMKSRSVNGLDRVMTINNVAIADKSGVLTLSRFADLWGSSTLNSASGANVDKKFAVEATTLDAYAKEKNLDHVDVIKMDIEGYEDKAYVGMKEIVANSPNLIMFLEFSEAGYANAKEFYMQLSKDFAYIFGISPDCSLSRINSYEEITNQSKGDWLMIVLAHRDLR